MQDSWYFTTQYLSTQSSTNTNLTDALRAMFIYTVFLSAVTSMSSSTHSFYNILSQPWAL